jgi:hemerythrin-like domain-containing protein
LQEFIHAMKTATPGRGLLDRLRAQHRTIRRNLNRLESVASALERGEAMDRHELSRLFTFFREFVQAEHESIEESLLYPAIESRCPRDEVASLRRLEAEHAWGDRILRDLVPTSNEKTARLIRTFAPLLRLHIEREETQLFPIAERVLTPIELESLGRACDAVLAATSPGAHERWRTSPGAPDPWCLDGDWRADTELP